MDIFDLGTPAAGTGMIANVVPYSRLIHPAREDLDSRNWCLKSLHIAKMIILKKLSASSLHIHSD
jgi:hypothetical protein